MRLNNFLSIFQNRTFRVNRFNIRRFPQRTSNFRLTSDNNLTNGQVALMSRANGRLNTRTFRFYDKQHNDFRLVRRLPRPNLNLHGNFIRLHIQHYQRHRRTITTNMNIMTQQATKRRLFTTLRLYQSTATMTTVRRHQSRARNISQAFILNNNSTQRIRNRRRTQRLDLRIRNRRTFTKLNRFRQGFH